jgi:hypothetical protein
MGRGEWVTRNSRSTGGHQSYGPTGAASGASKGSVALEDWVFDRLFAASGWCDCCQRAAWSWQLAAALRVRATKSCAAVRNFPEFVVRHFTPNSYGTRQMSSTPDVCRLFAFPSGSAIRPSTTIGLFQWPLPHSSSAICWPD